jgi:hypothetical protein
VDKKNYNALISSLVFPIKPLLILKKKNRTFAISSLGPSLFDDIFFFEELW